MSGVQCMDCGSIVAGKSLAEHRTTGCPRYTLNQRIAALEERCRTLELVIAAMLPGAGTRASAMSCITDAKLRKAIKQEAALALDVYLDGRAIKIDVEVRE